MKIIHKEGFTDAELAEYRSIVFKSFLSLLFPILLSKFISSQPLADKVLDYRPDSETSNLYFPSDIAEAIHQLWKDPIITKIMDEHTSEFYLMDSAA